MIRLVSPQKEFDFNDVLIVPQRSDGQSRNNVILERQFTTKHSGAVFTSIPIIASNMYATGTFKMAKALSNHHMMTALHKYYKVDALRDFIIDINQQLLFVTIGESGDQLTKLIDLKLCGENKDKKLTNNMLINIDAANGYRASFINFIQRIRHHFRDSVIMAGNVCTPEMTQEIIIAGADIVKIGIGPGSVCETRRVTGVGYPQLSAISNCANAAHNLKGLICADGGCKEVGDVCKAFCAGADFVMLGGMLAGTEECDGKWLEPSPPDFKHKLRFYGMSSHEAMEAHGGLEKEYRASEGKCIEVPYKGPVDNIVKEILGGLRSCGTYIGAMQIKHFNKHANFIRIR